MAGGAGSSRAVAIGASGGRVAAVTHRMPTTPGVTEVSAPSRRRTPSHILGAPKPMGSGGLFAWGGQWLPW